MDFKKIPIETKNTIKKKIPSPFPLNLNYPNKLTLLKWDLSNYLFNKLYPIKPWIYGLGVSATFGYFYKTSTDILPLKIDVINNYELLRLLKLIGLSAILNYLPVYFLRNFVLRLFVFRYKGFVTENPKNPSKLLKLWSICYEALKRFAPPKLETCDAFLPKLPVPPLKDTIQRYLESVECILTKDEYENVKILAENFAKNEGKWLQLLAKTYSMFTDNYVTTFWEKYAYLMSRKPLLINSSVAHCDLIYDVPANQALRAAHIVHIEALSMLAMAKQAIKPIGDGIVYSGHYKKLYATTRVPGLTIDNLKCHRLSKHVLIFFNGSWYTIDAFDSKNKLYSIEQLYQIFVELIQRKEQLNNPTEAKIAALTHDQRDLWHKNRQKFFLNNKNNKLLLEKIEAAFCVIVLQKCDYEYVPEDPSQMDYFMASMLGGDGNNRWVDKSLNYIIGKNGRVGGTTEHSIGDGIEFDHLFENFVAVDMNYMTYPIEVVPVENLPKFVHDDKRIKLAERLKFDITNEMELEIEAAYNRFQIERNNLDVASIIFTEWGKGRIKSGKCSPDAFIQMAIQLTNFKQQGKFVLTYESGSSRFFARSRTETLRTVTKDSCDFVNAMLNSNSNNNERVKLLRKACETHTLKNREIMLGKGVDRHLFVLYVLSRAIQKPSQFLDYYIGQPWMLSTSQPPNVTKQIDEDSDKGNTWLGASFGPVCEQGYGVCYRFAGEHTICIHITSFKSAPNTDSNKFRSLFIESLHEMVNLFI